jgi:hypothetical protein
MPPDETLTLGPFRLRVDPARAAAFARETGGDVARVPLSFPAVWLTDPAMFEPVNAMCEELAVVPVHESQSFAYEAPLIAGDDYDVTVSMRREETPPRLVIEAAISALDGALVAKSDTMLRLVPRAGFGGGS